MQKHHVDVSQLLTEVIIPVRKAGTYFPRSVSASAVERYIAVGVRGVQLQIFRVGGVRMTTRQSILRWIEATQRPDGHSRSLESEGG